MNIKCIKCGLKDAVSMGLCQDCIDLDLKLKVQPMTITLCRKCDGVMVGKRWFYGFSPKDAESLAKKSVSISDSKFTLTAFDLTDLSIQKESAMAMVSYSGTDGVNVTKTVDIPLAMGSISCPRCNRITGSSFEAIVQLRPASGKDSQVFRDALKSTIEFAGKSEDRKSNRYIMKQHQVQGGYDLYLGSKSFAESIVNRANSSYLCEIRKTKKLFGREEGYDTYRYTYLVRIIDYDKGSVILLNNDKYIVNSITQGTISLIPVDGGRSVSVTKNELVHSRVRLSDQKAELSDFMVISANDSEAMLLGINGEQLTMQIKVSGKESIQLLKYKQKYYYTE